jgi:hypothetical protein
LTNKKFNTIIFTNLIDQKIKYLKTNNINKQNLIFLSIKIKMFSKLKDKLNDKLNTVNVMLD